MNLLIIIVTLVIALILVKFIQSYFVKYTLYLFIVILILFVAMNYLSYSDVIESNNKLLVTGFAIIEKSAIATENIKVPEWINITKLDIRNLYK